MSHEVTRKLLGRGREWPEAERLLPAARRVPVPAAPRRIARRVALATICFLVFAALMPWQQNLSGAGQVVAYAADERPQPLQSTIGGRVVRWHVLEGETVEAGQLLVDLADNDPERLRRLERRVDAARSQLEAYRAAATAYEERVQALEQSQRAQIDAARAEVQIAREALAAQREALAAAEAGVATARLQQTRLQGLANEGLASERDRELAELAMTNANADLATQQARLRSAEASLQSKRAALDRAEASTEADLRSATAALRSAQTQVASADASLLSAESEVAQQAAQTVRAPREGVVQRIHQQAGVQVSRGTTLATIVPATSTRAVALYVDGNDAALITPGRKVRLQFEGWPAVQFSGWPSVAVGTFGGVVSFVDPSDDGSGDFRVVVTSDPEDQPWPDTRYLRQGTRAKGWVLLDEVSVGFELWRQINGFPPALESAPTSGSSSSGTP